jgi:hypothetical protein
MSKNRHQRNRPHHAAHTQRPLHARECPASRRDAIEDYVARHLAPATLVLHEHVSELVHIDVHIVRPAPERPFWFLFTTGMSALPMHVPPGYGLIEHAELALALPTSWPSEIERWKRETRWYWPIRELIATARSPHRRRTWVGSGHTFANSDPPAPLDRSTRLAATLLMPCALDGAERPTIHTDVDVAFLQIWPLHADELQYKLKHGLEALLDLFDVHDVGDVIDPDRPSCVGREASARANASSFASN